MAGEKDKVDPLAEDDQKKLTEEEEKKRNSEQARIRREREEAERVEQAEIRGVIRAIDGMNPFTNQPVKTKSDVEEYLLMKEIKAKGGDPLADYSKKLKEKEAEKAESERKKRESEEAVEKDLKTFSEKHPDIDVKKLIDDEDFQEFAEGKFGRKSLTEIYDAYMKHVEKIGTEAAKKVAKSFAIKKANPGSASEGSKGGGEGEFYTEAEIDKMSFQEIQANLGKVNKSLEKIRKDKSKK